MSEEQQLDSPIASHSDALDTSPRVQDTPLSTITPLKSSIDGSDASVPSPLTPFSAYGSEASPSKRLSDKQNPAESFLEADFRRFSGRSRRKVQRLVAEEVPKPKIRLNLSKKRKSTTTDATATTKKRKSDASSSVASTKKKRKPGKPATVVQDHVDAADGQVRDEIKVNHDSPGKAVHPKQDTAQDPDHVPDIDMPEAVAPPNSPPVEPIPDNDSTSVSELTPTPPSIADDTEEVHETVKSPSPSQSPIPNTIPGPPPIDVSLYQELLEQSRCIMKKTPISSKPEPRGKPLVWAPNRQALCETILYFQSWQSACYISKGVLYSFMFDSNGHSRDLIDGDVIIARAGGGMARDKVTGEMQQNKSQTENNQTQAVRAAIASQNPIVIFCGSENTDVPTKMPHRYQALGWYKPTAVWAEKSESKGKIWTNYKYRFEKLQTGDESWWVPKEVEHEKSPEAQEDRTDSEATADIHLNVDSGQESDVPAQAEQSSIISGEGESEEAQTLTDLAKTDAAVSATPEVMTDGLGQEQSSGRQLPENGTEFGTDGENADLGPAHKDSAHDDVSTRHTAIPSVGDLDPPTIFECTACSQPSQQVYLIGWMCLNSTCPNFWLLSNGFAPLESYLDYDPRFLKQFTTWISEAPPYPLRPALPDPSSRLGESVSFAMTRGMCCPQCGKCSSRYKWAGWFCECGFSHTPQHAVIPSTIVRDPWHSVSGLYAQCHDWADANMQTSVHFTHNYRIIAYEIPGLEGCSISHFVANRTVNEEEKGPDEMFEALQSMDCGLERRSFVTGKEEFMTAFSNNRGMPYKFVAKGESMPFEGAPWPLTETRSRLNWASRLVLKEKFKKEEEFNELLTIGYFDGQNIKYHDDGEKGLGETVASLSLGFPADMWFRVKSKHWTGMTKSGQFVNARPLPATANFKARTEAYEELNEDLDEGEAPKAEQLRKLATKIHLQDNLRDRKPWLRLRLSHGDVVVMHGRQFPIPLSVFPSTYRSDAAQSDDKVDEQVKPSTQRPGREEHESRYESSEAYRRGPRNKNTRYEVDIEEERRRPGRREEDIRIYSEDRRAPRDTRIEIEETRFRKPRSRHIDAHIEVDRHDTRYDTPLDRLEQDYRARTVPLGSSGWEDKSTRPRDYPTTNIDIHETTYETRNKRDMGYYDEDGHYHSFRHGVQRAADRILHPIHGGHHHHHHHRDRVEEVVVEDREVPVSAPRRTEMRESVRYVDRGMPPNTVTIPCHHIRIGDLVILQGRPCQVIRITTSQHTGQHRYLGVDLFTKELHEESSFQSNPSPSVVVQNMLGPVFKQYRILDITESGRLVAMTETGNVIQSLPVLDQNDLLRRIESSFNNGRGSVRVLVINDEGRELAVDYKIVHGSRL
ncbi:2OG-Fe(II) oxygenase-like protein 7 [Elsinoe australis]|uniref:2OG-Fe(II) oxygenase-like protein 7 n=1 Tax=Elsinoe australis TaxID=40998 RepID=A0A4U7B0E4_9PEZI|nr:2OG-Fe(II) oxygenase-like protein 7 [Elsinoe australis]